MARIPNPFNKPEPETAKKPVQQTGYKRRMAKLEKEKLQRKWFLGALIVIGVAILGLITFGLLDHFLLRENRAVAKVDGEKITVSEFQKRVQYSRWQMGQQYLQYASYYQMLGSDPNYGAQLQQSMQQLEQQLNPAFAESVGEQVLNRLKKEVLIRHLAEKQGITVSDAEIEKDMQETFGYFPNGTPTPGPTSAPVPTATVNPKVYEIVTQTPTMAPLPTLETTPTLAATATLLPSPTIDPSVPTATTVPTATLMNADGYATQIATYLDPLKAYGLNRADLLKLFKTKLLEAKLMESVTKDVSGEQEQVWARHILVGLEDEALAKDIYKQLMDGADFAQLAMTFSNDGTAANGGDLGWFGTGQMVPEFEQAAFALKPGEYSQPVKTQYGWHIIQCIDRGLRPLDSYQLETLKNKEFDTWLTEQEGTVKIETYDTWKELVPTTPGVPQY